MYKPHPIFEIILGKKNYIGTTNLLRIKKKKIKRTGIFENVATLQIPEFAIYIKCCIMVPCVTRGCRGDHPSLFIMVIKTQTNRDSWLEYELL